MTVSAPLISLDYHWACSDVSLWISFDVTDSKSSDQRATETAALWRLLDKKQKAKYRDSEFLATLPNPFMNIWKAAEERANLENSNIDGKTVPVGPKKRRKQFVDLKPEEWAKKTMLDVSQTTRYILVELIAD
jgi:hypothetical protein